MKDRYWILAIVALLVVLRLASNRFAHPPTGSVAVDLDQADAAYTRHGNIWRRFNQ
jgi:hypothetical protein